MSIFCFVFSVFNLDSNQINVNSYYIDTSVGTGLLDR